MIVVADSGPLHYLILIDQAQLLRSLYREVAIPLAVMAELSSPSAPEPIRAWLASPPSWLSVLSIDVGSARQIDDRLDLGEREAIALAESLHADLLLIDERAGRAEAKRLGLRVTGTLGVLRAAVEAGMVSSRAVVNQLRGTNFYVDEALLEAVFEGLEDESP